jgi:hypothetical protein
VPALKLSFPLFALPTLRGRLGPARPRLKAVVSGPEPLPPVLVVEGNPDPSLRSVIDATADRMGASVCSVDDLRSLALDPDLDAVVGLVLTRPLSPGALLVALLEARRLVGDRPVVVLAPQPVSPSPAAAIPLDPSFVVPPVTVSRLLFALGGAESKS